MVKALFCEFPEIPCFYSNFSQNAEIPAEFHTVGIPYRWNSIPLEFHTVGIHTVGFHTVGIPWTPYEGNKRYIWIKIK
jgi:hypothetical protein